MTQPKVAALLEKLTRIIPGIAGYQDREKRRDADKAVRMKAATEISRCRDLLSEAMNDLSRSGGLRNLRVIGNLERLVTKLDRIEDEMRYAPSGYAGWFDRESITLEDRRGCTNTIWGCSALRKPLQITFAQPKR